MHEKEKIDLLIENYKIVSEETKSYLTEMIRCFLYTAILLALGFGFGNYISPGSQTTSGGQTNEPLKFIPFALIGLFTYFFSLGFMYVKSARYKAQIEGKINEIAKDSLFGFELLYKPELLKTGFLPYGKKNSRIVPVPNFFLGIGLIIAFIYLGQREANSFLFKLYVGIGFAFGGVALYVFLFIPRVIEKFQKRKGWIK